MQLIETSQQLCKWLKLNQYFEEHGFLVNLQEHPLQITVGNNIYGSFVANTLRKDHIFKLKANKIIEWDKVDWKNPASDFISKQDFISSMDSFNTELGVGLNLITNSMEIKLITDKLEIIDEGIHSTKYTPVLSDAAIFVTAEIGIIPAPDFWQEELKAYGYDIVFRKYGGEKVDLQQVPSDYTGYYIQLANFSPQNEEGIFIKHLEKNVQNISLSFQRSSDDELGPLWWALTKILAALPEAKISCGNCEFTGEEWLQLLSNKKL